MQTRRLGGIEACSRMQRGHHCAISPAPLGLRGSRINCTHFLLTVPSGEQTSRYCRRFRQRNLVERHVGRCTILILTTTTKFVYPKSSEKCRLDIWLDLFVACCLFYMYANLQLSNYSNLAPVFFFSDTQSVFDRSIVNKANFAAQAQVCPRLDREEEFCLQI